MGGNAMIQSYRNLPPIVSGYPLDDVWSVVVPVARTNLVANPSFEVATTSWTAIGGSIARSTTQQYHGAYSLAITPTATTTDGARFDTVSLTSGTTYAYSAKVRGVGGLKYVLSIETTGGVAVASKTFTANGRWQWVYGYYTETSTTTRRVTLRKSGHASTAVFYLDGVQVEAIAAGETVSTYIDGDQLGFVANQQPPAYYWNGTPHASTSTRGGLTRAGGMVVPFRKYGFLLTAIIGLGLAQPLNVATEYARIDGGYDDYTRKPTRQFTLTGRFQGRTYQQLRDQRGRLARLFDRDLIAQDQRLLLLRHMEDARGEPIGTTARVTAKYEGGLGGNTDNQHAETVPITFTSYLPLMGSDGESGTALAVQQTIADTDSVAERQANGTWRGIDSTFNNAVNALLYATDGKLYIAGDFTTPQTRVASWDGTTLSAMGSGLPDSIITLAQGPDGSIYAGGASMTISAVTGTVAKWNGSAWAIVGTNNEMINPAASMIFGHNGNLYVGGNNAAIRATLDVWDGSAWTNIITHSASSTFYSLVEGPQGLYVGGSFTNLNADANQDNIALYSIEDDSWSALGTGLNGAIEWDGLTIGLNGLLYAIGDFTTAGGVTANHAAVWNGTAWTAMGSGLTGQAGIGNAITLADGSIVMGGLFSAANGITFPDAIARWNGSTFVPLDIDLPLVPGSSVRALGSAVDGRFAVGYNDSGSSTAAATTTITNTGTARTYPTLTIEGPDSGTSRIWQCVNVTTGRAIYFNYTINAGETARLVFEPDKLSFTSDFQGNIAGTIIGGSNEADFFLQPGANIISFFSASSTVTATMYWRPQYVSLDDVP